MRVPRSGRGACLRSDPNRRASSRRRRHGGEKYFVTAASARQRRKCPQQLIANFGGKCQTHVSRRGKPRVAPCRLGAGCGRRTCPRVSSPDASPRCSSGVRRRTAHPRRHLVFYGTALLLPLLLDCIQPSRGRGITRPRWFFFRSPFLIGLAFVLPGEPERQQRYLFENVFFWRHRTV